MSKIVRTALVTCVGVVVGTYSWVLARRVAYSTMNVEPEDMHWATPDSPMDDYDLDQSEYEYDDDGQESWEEHMEQCPSCQALGQADVMNSAKLRSIAKWIEYSDSLMERLLDLLDDVPDFMTPDELEYIQSGLALHDNLMVSELNLWAEMIDDGLDPS